LRAFARGAFTARLEQRWERVQNRKGGVKMLGHRKLYDEQNPTYREALGAAEAARRLPLPPGVDDIYLYDVAQAAIGDPDPKEIDWAFVAAKMAYEEMRRSHAFQLALRNRKDRESTPAVLPPTKYSGANNWPAGHAVPTHMAPENEESPVLNSPEI
jgi:hypothetical protein